MGAFYFFDSIFNEIFENQVYVEKVQNRFLLLVGKNLLNKVTEIVVFFFNRALNI